MEEAPNDEIDEEPVFCTKTVKRSRLHDNFGVDTRGRRLHPVWEYFIVLDNTKMECLVCARKFKTISSTTVCKHHLKSKHPELFAHLADEQTDWRHRVSANCFSEPEKIKEVDETENFNTTKTLSKLLLNVSGVSDFSFDDEKLKLMIIKSVKDRPAIWDSSNKDHCNPASIEKLITEIAQEISDKWRPISVNQVIQIWNKLIETHNMSEHVQAREENGEKKKFFDALMFLKSTSPCTKTDTNKVITVKHAKKETPQEDEDFFPVSNFFTPFSLFSQSAHLLKNQSILPTTIDTTPNLLSPAISTEINTSGVAMVEENRDESTPLGFLVVDLHRKLRQKQKLGKALQFKKNLFTLISEFEQEFV